MMDILATAALTPLFTKLWDKMVDSTEQQNHTATFISLKSNAMQLSAKAFDVDLEVTKAELLGNKKRKREVKEWLKEVQIVKNEFHALENEMHTEGFIKRFFCGGRAGKLDERISKLIEQSQYFREVVVVCETIGDTLLTCELVGKKFERNLERVVEFVLEDDGLSIGIYGMGGIGKTTLAKHVNNRLLKHFGYCVSWITVSQEFLVTSLQDEISKDVGLDLSHVANEEKRASKLHKVLSDKKNWLFIFDDVWEAIDLEKVGIPLIAGGCKVMITTRSHEVCRRMRCKRIIDVKTMDNEEAWNLFTEKLGQEVELTPEVQEIGRSMVELCDGLPLGIITLAGSMRGETSMCAWSDALEVLKESAMEQEDMKEKVFKVLKYSFDRLGQRDEIHNGYSKLQRCFLHCSLYPEDHEIEKEELIRIFILEKFLDKRKSRESMIVQGHTILDRLVNVCLLENSYYNRVKMHDLVRAMALKITEGKTKVITGQHYLKEIPNEENWTKDLEKFSLMRNGIRQIPPNMSPNCSRLTTLLLRKNPLECVPNSFFLKMCSLCILDLSTTKIKKLPDSLSDMEKLEGLLLAKCRKLTSIPNMGKLKQLKELDVSGTAIREVPKGMENIVNLKSLSLHGTKNMEILPEGFLLNFPHLQCLHLPYHIQAPVEEIEKLNHLEEFCGRLTNGSQFNLLVKCRPSWSYNIVVASDGLLYNFDICGGFRQSILPRYDLMDKATIRLQSIQPPELSICAGRSNYIAENFVVLNTDWMHLRECNEMEFVWRKEQLVATGVVASTSVIASPVSQPPTNSNLFSSLTRLYIVTCKKMKKLGFTASHLPNIGLIWIEDCEALEVLFEEESGSGKRSKEVTASVVYLPKLWCLYLHQLPRLKSICDNTTIVCTSIVSISLKRCTALKKLPLVLGEPKHHDSPYLSFTIHLNKSEKEWWDKMELGHPTHQHLEPFLILH